MLTDMQLAADALELERLRPIPSLTRIGPGCGHHCVYTEGQVRHCGCVDCHGSPS